MNWLSVGDVTLTEKQLENFNSCGIQNINGLLVVRGEKTWSNEGVSNIKNFERKANKHAISERHLVCQEQFKLLGKNIIDHALSEGRRLQAIKYNEQVGINRRILARLIHVVCYLGKQELAFRGHDERKSSLSKGNYLELLELLSQEEQILKEHFLSNSLFKGTSSDVQNDLIACITDVINTKIMNDLKCANFVSIQADETTDVSCKSQMSIILRYVVDNNIEERFIGFFDVSKDKSAVGLSNILLAEITKWNINDKIICQTYDGAAVMAGNQNGVQAIIKKTYPKALFIHCYAHQLNLIFLHGSKNIKSVRIFISDLTMFHTFFSRSPKRTELLREKGFKLPKSCETRWNYHSRAAATISTHFKELQKAISYVTEGEDWDPISISTAYGLLHKLSNQKFVYLLCLFHRIFIYSDHVFLILQTKCTADVQTCINEIKNLSTQLSAMRNDQNTITECCESAMELNNELQYTDKDINSLKNLTYEILDSIIIQTEVRFQDFHVLKFIELANNNEFINYKKHFPIEKLNQLLKVFPGVFEQERLQNELTVIYNDNNKHLPPKELLNYIIKAELQEVYVELTKLLQLILCIPVTTASSERSMSTLKRIKTFLRNTMTHDRFSNLCTMAIEKKMLSELATDPTFIDNFLNIYLLPFR
ncbi:zinc finger MYM-type protein 1-like [Rhopalosiphum padi]|uniref:zinc finger MYM-type protein 1-like n=1 Tax=Rhopalosiphum padi TaxID=40932 RepID=UPI00298E8AC9|nr:zinc finger MYM-type protein 1-like [Rhopalosiphum padi]